MSLEGPHAEGHCVGQVRLPLATGPAGMVQSSPVLLLGAPWLPSEPFTARPSAWPPSLPCPRNCPAWGVEFLDPVERWINPLMGWTSTGDAMHQVCKRVLSAGGLQ